VYPTKEQRLGDSSEQNIHSAQTASVDRHYAPGHFSPRTFLYQLESAQRSRGFQQRRQGSAIDSLHSAGGNRRHLYSANLSCGLWARDYRRSTPKQSALPIRAQLVLHNSASHRHHPFLFHHVPRAEFQVRNDTGSEYFVSCSSSGTELRDRLARVSQRLDFYRLRHWYYRDGLASGQRHLVVSG